MLFFIKCIILPIVSSIFINMLHAGNVEFKQGEESCSTYVHSGKNSLVKISDLKIIDPIFVDDELIEFIMYKNFDADCAYSEYIYELLKEFLVQKLESQYQDLTFNECEVEIKLKKLVEKGSLYLIEDFVKMYHSI